YGVVSENDHSVQAHKAAYRLVNGPIPYGLCVLHECDNRNCINPAHLFLGTLGDNKTDRKRKGRNADPRGQNNKQAKLAPAEIVEVYRLARQTDLSQREIGKRFGICQQWVSDIARGLAWPHLTASGEQR